MITQRNAIKYLFSLGQLTALADITMLTVGSVDPKRFQKAHDDVQDLIKELADITQEDDADLGVKGVKVDSPKKAYQVPNLPFEDLVEVTRTTGDEVFFDVLLDLADLKATVLSSSSGDVGDEVKLSFDYDGSSTPSLAVTNRAFVTRYLNVVALQRQGKMLSVGELIAGTIYWHSFTVPKYDRTWLDELMVNVRYLVER